jgi:uncharacterized protein
MVKIGLISDTHGFLDEKVFEYFKNCDEIWHAGDFGDFEIYNQLNRFKPTRGVFGNIDANETLWNLKENEIFEIEGINILMTHIGGLPPSYTPRVRKLIQLEKPAIFICGHSHILRVIKDSKNSNLLYINPGAAGNEGFHKTKTIMRFELNQGKIENLEVIELGPRGQIKKTQNEKNI